MNKKIFRSIFSVAIFILLSCLIIMINSLYGYFTEKTTAQVKEEAIYIAHGIEKDGISYLESLTRTGIGRITLIDSSGIVLYDSKVNASEMENHLDREEIARAISYGEGECVRQSSTLSEKTFYYALKLDCGYILRISTQQFTVFTMLAELINPIVTILIISILLSSILASKLAKKIVAPINKIDFDNPSNKIEYEELAPLILKIRNQNEQIKNQIEESLQKQQEFSAITENMDEVFLVCDIRGKILSCNHGAKKLLSITEEKNIFNEKIDSSIRSCVEKSLRGEHTQGSMEAEGLFYQIVTNPVYKDECVVGSVVFIMDTTEKTKQEIYRREFTANVSHELKTPLTSISGFAEIIKNGLVKNEDISRFAGKIYDEAGRLITLVGDIIKLSQLDENADTIKKENIDLYDICESVISHLSSVANKKSVSFSLFGSHSYINGAEQIIDEMIYNLCDNAIKYNKPGGKVSVSVIENDGCVLLEVSDTGIGIPQSDKDRVFERFYRVNKSHSKEIGGTGLGLSIVKHGAAFHNATIVLESELNKGTKIKIKFLRNKNITE